MPKKKDKIEVRIKATGQEGYVDKEHFDPNIFENIESKPLNEIFKIKEFPIPSTTPLSRVRGAGLSQEALSPAIEAQQKKEENHLKAIEVGINDSAIGIGTQIGTGNKIFDTDFKPEGIDIIIAGTAELIADAPLFFLGGKAGQQIIKTGAKTGLKFLGKQALKKTAKHQGALAVAKALPKIVKRRGAKEALQFLAPSIIEGAALIGVPEALKNPLQQQVAKGDVDLGEYIKNVVGASVAGAIGGPVFDTALGAGARLLKPIIPKYLRAASQRAGVEQFGIRTKGEIDPGLKQLANEAGIPIKGAPKSITETPVQTEFDAKTLSGTYLSEAGQQFTPGQRKVALDAFKADPREIAKQRRFTQSWQETEKRARSVGLSMREGEVFIRGQKIEPGTSLNAEALEKMGQIRRGLINDVADIAETHLKNPNDKNILQKYHQLKEAYTLFENRWYGVRAESGRALNAFKKYKSPSDKLELEVLKSMRMASPEENKILARLLAEAKINVQLNLRRGMPAYKAYKPLHDIMDKYVNATFTEKFVEMATLFKLLNPKTQLRNILGNAIFTGTRIAERFVGAGLEAPKPLVGKQREIFFGEVPAEIFGTALSLRKAIAKAIPALLDDTAAATMKGQEVMIYRPAIKGAFGKGLRALTVRPLAAMDLFFRELSNNSVLYAEIYKNLAKRGINPVKNKKLFIDEYYKLMKDTPDHITLAVEEEATRRVFQAPIKGVVGRLEQIRRDLPISRLLLPFLKTPTNIFKEGVRRSPLAPALPSFREDIMAGGARATDALGAMMLGSAASASLTMAAISGQFDITGQMPRDAGTRAIWFAEGKQPFSVRVGDKWISYRGIEPFSSILANAASLKEAFENIDINNLNDFLKQWDAVAAQMTGDYIRFSKDQSFMQGGSEFFKAIDQAEEGKLPSSILGFLIKGAILPTSVQDIAKAIDPELRQKPDIFSTVQSGIPVLRGKLETRPDIFGQQISLGGIPKGDTPLERSLKLFTPKGIIEGVFRPSPVTKDPTIKELGRLNKSVALKISPVGRNYAGIRLTPKEYKEVQTEIGLELKGRLDDFMGSPGFPFLTDLQKKKEIKKIETKVKNEIRSPGNTRAFKYKIIFRALEEEKDANRRSRLVDKLATQGHITELETNVFKDPNATKVLKNVYDNIDNIRKRFKRSIKSIKKEKPKQKPTKEKSKPFEETTDIFNLLRPVIQRR